MYFGPALRRSKNEFGHEPCHLIGLEPSHVTIYCAWVGQNWCCKNCKAEALVIFQVQEDHQTQPRDCLTVTSGRKWEGHLGGVGGALRCIFAVSIYLYKKRRFLCVCPSVRLSQKISKVLEGLKGPRGARRDMLTAQGSGIN